MVRGSLGCLTSIVVLANILITIGPLLLVFVLYFGYIVVLVPLLIYIKREEKKLPAQYLRRVGTLSMLGYGVLATEDDQPSEEGKPPGNASDDHPEGQRQPQLASSLQPETGAGVVR